MARAPTEISSLARSHTKIAIKVLAGIAKDGTNESARVAAACALLDRGWGKPPQAQTGKNGEGCIEAIIRHIVEGGEEQQPPQVDAVANGTDRRDVVGTSAKQSRLSPTDRAPRSRRFRSRSKS